MLRKREYGMKKRRSILCLLAAMCLVLAACGSGSRESEVRGLTIGTADSGGTMYPVGKAIAKVITEDTTTGISVNVNASTGSAMNVQALTDGNIDLGLVTGDMAYEALHGLGGFAQPAKGLRVIGAVYTSTANWMAPVSEGIYYVHELDGKSVVLGPEGSTSDILGRKTLESIGVQSGETQLLNNSLGAGAELVAGGAACAIQGFAGIPIEGLVELANKRACRLLRFTKKELDDFLAENESYYRDVIPAGSYAGQMGAVPTIGVKCLLCVNETMDDETAYRLTEILWNSREKLAEAHPSMEKMLEKDFVCQDLPIPLHPAAEKFYQEHKLL